MAWRFHVGGGLVCAEGCGSLTAMKRLGVEVKYIEVPGGSHGDVAAPNMSAIFDFFDTHRKGVKSTASNQ